MKYALNMAIYLLGFLLIAWVGVSNCASQVTPDRLSYDIEVKKKEATYPLADTVYTIKSGDTLTIVWNQELRYANAADSAKTWDTNSGWRKAIKGYEYPVAFPQFVGRLDSIDTPGTWTLRIWTWLFNPDIPSGEPGRWQRSPAPTDEVQLSLVEVEGPPPPEPKPIPAPANPVLINVRVR